LGASARTSLLNAVTDQETAGAVYLALIGAPIDQPEEERSG
jgi:hypothetical protein